jgi:hypothetical protein
MCKKCGEQLRTGDEQFTNDSVWFVPIDAGGAGLQFVEHFPQSITACGKKLVISPIIKFTYFVGCVKIGL